MTSRRINLLPPPRRLARRLRRRARAWIAVDALLLAAVAAALGSSPLWRRPPAPEVGLALDALRARLDAATSETTSIRREIDLARADAAVARIVRSRPDWSILLAAIAAGAGEMITLQSITLEPTEPAPAPGATAPAEPAGARTVTREPQEAAFAVEVAGIARSQDAVTEFVVRLERSGLFARVELAEARKSAGADSMTFQLRGLISSRRVKEQP